MSNQSPYNSPESELTDVSSYEDMVQYRKTLVPTWIKVFGWLFIVFGCLIPFVGIYGFITGEETEFSLYGLEVVGSVYSPVAFIILALFLAHGACAFGLLFGKTWGVQACIPLAYISVAICIFTMFTGNGFFFRLELLVLIPYLMKLHKIRSVWTENENI